jgi:hypothetical protein
MTFVTPWIVRIQAGSRVKPAAPPDRHYSPQPRKSVIVVIIRIREIILCTAPAAQRLTIADFLQVVEPAGDAAIAGAVEGIRTEIDALTVHTGVDLTE